MPSRTRAKNAAIAAKSAALPKIPKELLGQFNQGPMTEVAIQDVSMALKKELIDRVSERALRAMTQGRSRMR